VIDKTRGKQPSSVAIRDARVAVHLHSLQAATGRASLQDVAAELFLRQPSRLRKGPAVHPGRVIEAGTGRHQANILTVGDEPERFPRNAKANL